ncbi:unnamed protein product [Rhizophagus irregularis]|nr:unnamed protein product [Rhizophagus irregularis]
MTYNNRYTTKWNNWIEEAIFNEHINCYEYKDFYNFEGIGSGGFGKVYRANWKDSHNIYALKSLKDSEAKKFVEELKIQRKVNVHDNIIRFYGITRVDQNYYMLVMEYADGASAVSCLHNLGIIHRDLHSNNVLVHGNNVKLADFGLSKKTDESVISKLYGIIPYIDPKKFASDSYSRNKKSDIYSIGVLLWEISSCRPPFEGQYNQYGLVNQILQGLRETPIPNTPEDYKRIYTDCWKYESDDRPDIREVVNRLVEVINNNSSHLSRNNSSPSSRNNSSLSSRNNLSQTFKQKGSKSKKDIVDGIAALPYKIYDKSDTFKAMYWYQKSAEQGNHEARESFYRLRSAPSKTLSVDSIDLLGDMSIFFPPH